MEINSSVDPRSFFNLPNKSSPVHDIPELHLIRNSVREYVLSDLALIKDEDYAGYLVYEGKASYAK